MNIPSLQPKGQSQDSNAVVLHFNDADYCYLLILARGSVYKRKDSSIETYLEKIIRKHIEK
jgi:hypothetical protein